MILAITDHCTPEARNVTYLNFAAISHLFIVNNFSLFDRKLAQKDSFCDQRLKIDKEDSVKLKFQSRMKIFVQEPIDCGCK